MKKGIGRALVVFSAATLLGGTLSVPSATAKHKPGHKFEPRRQGHCRDNPHFKHNGVSVTQIPGHAHHGHKCTGFPYG